MFENGSWNAGHEIFEVAVGLVGENETEAERLVYIGNIIKSRRGSQLWAQSYGQLNQYQGGMCIWGLGDNRKDSTGPHITFGPQLGVHR